VLEIELKAILKNYFQINTTNTRLGNNFNLQSNVFKSVVLIMLICAFSFNGGGNVILFNVLLHKIKKEVFEEKIKLLNKSDLLVFDFNKDFQSQIKWIKEGKEFQYQDEMYDVFEIEKNDSSVKLFCYNDEKETNLLTKFNYNNELNKIVTKILQNINLLLYFDLKKIFLFNKFEITFYISFAERVISKVIAKDYPPPKSAILFPTF
jgi:hypothetical protein